MTRAVVVNRKFAFGFVGRVVFPSGLYRVVRSLLFYRLFVVVVHLFIIQA